MILNYPVNLVGHDEWMAADYNPNPTSGDVITRDGEFIGTWRVVADEPEALGGGSGYYEFSPIGATEALFIVEFACLDYRISRGLALSNLVTAIRNWHEPQTE